MKELAKEPGMLRTTWAFLCADLGKGCSRYTRQTDTGTGRTLDLCMANQRDCLFYDGQYQTRGETRPAGQLSEYDLGIAEGVQVGFCRLQKDAIKVGPIALFDKKRVRTTPKD